MNIDAFARFFDDLYMMIEVFDPYAIITSSRNELTLQTTIAITLSNYPYSEKFVLDDKYIKETNNPAYEIANKFWDNVERAKEKANESK